MSATFFEKMDFKSFLKKNSESGIIKTSQIEAYLIKNNLKMDQLDDLIKECKPEILDDLAEKDIYGRFIREDYEEFKKISKNPNKDNEPLVIFFKDISSISPISPATEEVLIRSLKIDDSAREKILNAYIKFVLTLIKRYQAKRPFFNLLEEGVKELTVAVDKYDYKSGFKFSTYLTWRLRERMVAPLTKMRNEPDIPFGEVFPYTFNDIIDFKFVPFMFNGKNPAEYDIEPSKNEKTSLVIKKAALDVLTKNESLVIKLRCGLEGYKKHSREEIALKYETTPERIKRIEDSAIGKLKAINKMTEGSDNNKASSEFNDAMAFIRANINALLATLTETEAEILRLRYGLDTGEKATLEFVAEKMNLTIEEVKQIEDEAIRKLREINTRKKSEDL